MQKVRIVSYVCNFSENVIICGRYLHTYIHVWTCVCVCICIYTYTHTKCFRKNSKYFRRL